MIRLATYADMDRCIEMARQFYEAAQLAEFSFDEESAKRTFLHLVESDDGVLLVADKGGLVGMAAALCFPHYMNHSIKVAQELFWWVDQEQRGGTTGVRLLSALELWAKAKGCTTLTMVCLPIESPAEAIYARTGYRPLERSYLKRV